MLALTSVMALDRQRAGRRGYGEKALKRCTNARHVRNPEFHL
jgi:hypothetical protein